MSGGRTDEGVSFDMVGAVTSTREKEKNDSDLKIFETMLKAKKKKQKKSETAETNDETNAKIDDKDNTTSDNGANTTTEIDTIITATTITTTTTTTTDNFDITIDNNNNNNITIIETPDNANDIDSNYFKSDDNRDYPYTELLSRIYRQLNEHNPSFNEPKTHKLPPPQTHLIGSKKTGWGNFSIICNKLVRKPDHVKQFFLAEMNTTGNLDGDGNLILKGRWRPKQFESLLKKYIREYVECQNCHQPETIITKDNATRLFFLTCKKCNSTRSVAQIKAGFHAVSKDDRRQAKKHAN